MEVNPTICKLIIAGAVELVDREPVFTKPFTDHVMQTLSRHPSMGESPDGWSNIVTAFNKSLKELSLWDLNVIMSLLAYRMAFDITDYNESNDIRITDDLDAHN
jgi:hypothetical protein